MKIMGVDISSRSSGWSIIENDKLLEYGLIVPQSKSMTNAQKMYLFQVELRKIIDAKQPDEIAIEDVIQVRSISVLKLLARFNGIAIIESYRYTQKEPDLYEPSKWKSIMGCGGGAKKCEVQLSICQK
jgi:Holliday junction resolvasome RuvABC endonuclease subunit